jgi:hypothetical protein
MLRDLRVKIRNRYSRISSCDSRDFFALTKQFFDFIKQQPLLSAVIAEVMANNPEVVEEANAPNLEHAYGETADQAAVIGYVAWAKYAAQSKPDFFHGQVGITRSFSETLSKYRSRFLDPFFDYLDEKLEDGNVILATLIRYKTKVEWYRKEELQKLFADHPSRGEHVLAKHMFEYLFDQGITFNVEPQSASGRPDLLSIAGEHNTSGRD